MNKADYIALIKKHGNSFKVEEFEIRAPITHVNPVHLEEVLKFRKWHGFSTQITSSYRPGTIGYHPLGLATDQIIYKKWKEEPIDFLHAWNLATTWGFPGVGLYFDWNYTTKQGKVCRAPGLHLDSGYASNRPLRWICKEFDVIEAGETKTKRFYYYQSLIDGLFYNSERDEIISLEKAIECWK